MYPSILSFETINKLKLSFECGIPRSLHRLLATAIFVSNYTVQLQCLQRVPGHRVTEKCHFSTLNVGLAGTGNQTQATCLAGSVSRRSAIHYNYNSDPVSHPSIFQNARCRLLLHLPSPISPLLPLMTFWVRFGHHLQPRPASPPSPPTSTLILPTTWRRPSQRRPQEATQPAHVYRAHFQSTDIKGGRPGT
jgi:hypothetical protein